MICPSCKNRTYIFRSGCSTCGFFKDEDIVKGKFPKTYNYSVIPAPKVSSKKSFRKKAKSKLLLGIYPEPPSIEGDSNIKNLDSKLFGDIYPKPPSGREDPIISKIGAARKRIQRENKENKKKKKG